MYRHMAPDERPQQLSPQFQRILVPMKLGIIGEEMIATAVKLAGEQSAVVEALYVIRVPLSEPLDAERDGGRSGPRPRSPRRSCSATSTASRSSARRCAPARSARRSSTRPANRTPT